MTLSKQAERLALIGAVPFLAYGIAALAAGRMVGMPAPLGVVVLAGFGLAAALVTGLHAGLRRLAAQEASDLQAAPAAATLFAEQEAGARGVRARNLRQFERYALPGMTAIAAIVEATIGLYLLQRFGARGPVPLADQALPAAALLGAGAVILYLYGSYLAGLGYRGTEPVLRAIAAELVGSGSAGALMAVSLLFLTTDFPRVPVFAGYLLAALLLVRSLEKLLNVVIDIYRPRSAGTVSLVYESRLFGLLAQPRSMLASFGESLHYQFGIDVSEGRLRQLVWSALPLLLLQFVILFAFTCIVIVNPGEQAVIERFGRPLDSGVLEPGFHAKLPWPVDCVYRQQVDRIEQLYLGTPLPDSRLATSLWLDDASEPGDLFLTPNHLAGDQPAAGSQSSFNLLVATIVVHYRVGDLRAFLYRSANPEQMVTRLAQRELARYFAAHDLFDLLESDWRDIDRRLAEAIAAAVDRHGLGLEIVNVALVNLQPPKDAVPAFQTVIAAAEERQQVLLSASGNAEAAATEGAKLEAAIRTEALRYAADRTRGADAEREILSLRQEYFRKYPEMFRQWAYLDTVQAALKDKRKLVIATPQGRRVISIDLKEQSAADLFNFSQ